MPVRQSPVPVPVMQMQEKDDGTVVEGQWKPRLCGCPSLPC